MRRKGVSGAPPWDDPQGFVKVPQIHDLPVGGSHNRFKGVREEIGGNVHRHPIPRMRKGPAIELNDPV
jgi:hypothetical protein